MAGNSLFPAFVRIQYHSPFGLHLMTLPTLAFTNVEVGEDGDFATWDDIGIDGDVMVAGLVTTMLAEYQEEDITFDSWDVFTMASAEADPEWRYGAPLGLDGTGVALTGWRQATQATFTFRTTAGGISRLVLLDKPTNNLFGRYTVPGVSETALIAEYTAVGRGWAGRDNGRPLVFKNVTIKTNDVLRRKYGIA
jgi:hypothetical protein